MCDGAISLKKLEEQQAGYFFSEKSFYYLYTGFQQKRSNVISSISVPFHLYSNLNFSLSRPNILAPFRSNISYYDYTHTFFCVLVSRNYLILHFFQKKYFLSIKQEFVSTQPRSIRLFHLNQC